MNSYNKSELNIIAKEHGFIRDNLEKVMRLADILDYFHTNELLSHSLALKGGTAINLTVFSLPRLSVDIDLDYTVDCDRDAMLASREKVNESILRYMNSEGYHLSPSSRNPHTLDSWVFNYVNAGGNKDVIKIEINYSDRCHLFPPVVKQINIPFLKGIHIQSLSMTELYASKINALLGRCAARDLYDVYKMVENALFQSRQDLDLLRKSTFFYLTVGSSRDGEAVPTQFDKLPLIDAVKFPKIRAQRLPVLRQTEKFDMEKAKATVKEFLGQLLVPTTDETEYINRWNEGQYSPELLFEDTEIVQRISRHPMALWKVSLMNQRK